MIVADGSTDVSTYWVLRDSTNHAPKTDVTVGDIDVYYQLPGAAQSAKADLTALAAADSAHADNKGFHVGNGLYRIDWPDTCFDGGVGTKVWLIVVCTGVDTTFLEVELSPTVNVATIEGTDATDAINAACDTAIETYDLDHLIHTAESDTPADNSIIAKLAASDGDWSGYAASTDSLEAIRDQGDSAWETATGFSTHSAADVVTALDDGATLTTCATATGFSTHSAADVVTELGTGATLTACATATGFSTHSAGDVKTAMEAAGSYLAQILADTGTDGVVLGADSITAAKIADDAFSSEHFATGSLTADALATDAVTEITHGILDHDYTAHTTTGTLGQWLRAIRALIGGKSVENSGSTSVQFYDEGGSTTAGTMSWSESTKTRGEYSDF